MKSINPYLFFPGNCEEALNFYKGIFKGEITSLERFGNASMPVDDDYRDKVMHATLTFEDGLCLMFSDGAPHKKVLPGDNVHINLHYSNEAKMRIAFGKLAEGGEVHMDLQDTFWGSIFGQLVDKYGIRWMFNFEK